MLRPSMPMTLHLKDAGLAVAIALASMSAHAGRHNLSRLATRLMKRPICRIFGLIWGPVKMLKNGRNELG